MRKQKRKQGRIGLFMRILITEINGEDMALLEAYKKYNPDVVGYIRIPDTNFGSPAYADKNRRRILSES